MFIDLHSNVISQYVNLGAAEWGSSYITCLYVSPAQLIAQKKLHFLKILLSHVLVKFVQHHPDGKKRKHDRDENDKQQKRKLKK